MLDDEKEFYLRLCNWESCVKLCPSSHTKFQVGIRYWKNPTYKDRVLTLEEKWLTLDEAYEIAKFSD